MRFYEHQDDVAINQANPISGTPYAVLPVTTFVRVIAAGSYCTWTVQPTPLQLHFVIDGAAISYSIVNPGSVVAYTPSHYATDPPLNQAMIGEGAESFNRPFLLEGKSILITAEVTGGTVQNLVARIIHARYI